MSEDHGIAEQDRTQYFALRTDDDEVLLLLRHRYVGGALYGEVYDSHLGRWLEDARSFDVYTNGQDYVLVDNEEAEEISKGMAPGQ